VRIARPRTLRVTVGLLVVSLVGLLMVSALATGLARLRVASAQHVLDTRAFPARQAAADLGTAYVDQETGQRGYLLTGDPRFLEPYTSGVSTARQRTAELQRLLADDADGLRALRSVTDAATAWRTTIAEPEIALRRRGPIPPGQWETIGLHGKARFDQLRGRLVALEARTTALFGTQLSVIGRAQATANAVTIAAVALALAVAASGAMIFRRRFSRPLNRLLAQVQTVADGDYEAPITPAGPRELAIIAGSVDRMRESIVEHGRELVAAQRELTLREEHDRLATDLHDLTIQRVFALGLSLTSISRRQPDTAAALAPLVAETDRIIREVRSVIFDLDHGEGTPGLRRQVAELAEDSVRALGFSPSLDFAGPVDAVPEHLAGAALAVLREALSNVARHAAATGAEVRVAAEDGALTIVVADNGTGPGAGPTGNGIGRIQARAARLGGSATVAPGESGGTVVEWRVPLAGRLS
jgi:signal transduction histidine kinase